jgi:hypothetical protein
MKKYNRYMVETEALGYVPRAKPFCIKWKLKRVINAF